VFAALSQTPAALSQTLATAQQPAQLTLLQQGLRYYAAKKIRDAEFCFRQSSVEHPEDALPHYYLANLLAISKRHAEAIREYQTCYERDPFGVASGYCRKALISYNAPLPEPEAAPKEATVISAAERLNKTAPQATAKTAGAIRAQAEREISRSRVAAEQESSSISRDTEVRAQKIKQAAAADADAILYPPEGSYLSRYNQMHPGEAAQAAKQVRDNADENVKLERILAEGRASKYKDHFKAREKAVDEVAANLERELASKVVPGSARLREEGTGLFVRYYGSSADPVREVHESVARVVRHPVPLHSPTDTKNAANDDDDDSLPEVQSTVRGAVIRQK
jgi:hypothetical protein